jgi:hypothetical protein
MGALREINRREREEKEREKERERGRRRGGDWGIRG